MLVIISMMQEKKLALRLCQNTSNFQMRNHKKKLHQRKLLHKLLKSNQYKKRLQLKHPKKFLLRVKLDQLFNQKLRFMMMLQKQDNLWPNLKLIWKCNLKNLRKKLRLESMHLHFHNKKVILKSIKLWD